MTRSNEDVRNDTEKSITTFCKEGGILYFVYLMLYLLVINRLLAFWVENLF